MTIISLIIHILKEIVIYGYIASRVLNLLNGLFAQFDFETMPVNMVKLINWLGKESFLYVTWVSANLLK